MGLFVQRRARLGVPYPAASMTRRTKPDGGATAIEYGIMMALVAALLIGVVATLGESVVLMFNSAIDRF
jgi:pilus assembly protein Flp/PilA